MINNPVLPGSLGNVTSATSPALVGSLLGNLIQMGFIIGAIVFVFMLLIGGFNYISSGGDKESIQKAVKRITAATSGLLILLSLYVILKLISMFLGVNIISLNVPTLNGTL